MTRGKMTSAWATFKPDHKWTHFECNSRLPQTEGKITEHVGGWHTVISGKALLTFVGKKPKWSFCNTLQSLILWKEVSEHFPQSLFLVDRPIGLPQIYNHIGNFTPTVMFLLLLKYSCSLYILEWMWREPCQTFCMFEGCFWQSRY